MRVLLLDASGGSMRGRAARAGVPDESIRRDYTEDIMQATFEAEVDDKGNIRPKEPIALTPGSQLLITVVEGTASSANALLSEPALATDWGRAEEDAAWADLGPA